MVAWRTIVSWSYLDENTNNGKDGFAGGENLFWQVIHRSKHKWLGRLMVAYGFSGLGDYIA